MAFDYEKVIESCSRELTGHDEANGAGVQKIYCPLLMVYAGQEALQYKDYTLECFHKCWKKQADQIQVVDKNPFSAGTVKSATLNALQGGGFRIANQLLTAVFWDLMDDDFEAVFYGLNSQVPLPINYSNHRFFFLFYKVDVPEVRAVAESRVKRVLAWAQKKEEHVFLLSNVTVAAGILGEKEINENYALASAIVTMMDSYSGGGSNKNLLFCMEKKMIYSAGFKRLEKDTKGIAQTVITSFLEAYLHASDSQSETEIQLDMSVYNASFEGLFYKYIQPLLPEDPSFLNYMPYTSVVREALTPSRRLFGEGSFAGFSSDNAQDILKSMGDFWPDVLARYFMRPVRTYMEQISEDGQKESERIRREVVKPLYAALPYKQMKNPAIVNSLVKAFQKARDKISRDPIRVDRTDNLGAFLGQAAVEEVKKKVFASFYDLLLDEVQNISDYADAFEKLLKSTLSDLKTNPSDDDTIVQAYTRFTVSLVGADDSFIGAIRPCRDEESLWIMIKNYFHRLVTGSGKDVFHKSLMDELTWRAQAVKSTTVANIISDCFGADMSATRRVTTFDSPEADIYTLMSPHTAVGDEVSPAALGTLFTVPNPDEVQRVDIFQVDPEKILWSHQKEES